MCLSGDRYTDVRRKALYVMTGVREQQGVCRGGYAQLAIRSLVAVALEPQYRRLLPSAITMPAETIGWLTR